jgi:ABC-type uncharacterized transport system involved in gliding motility auxiliary subunit
LPQFRIYAQRVRELLEEIVARSKGKVVLEVIDPEPFSEAEDQASAYGLQGVPLGASGETLYFGLVGTNSTDGETLMPFIQPEKESFLEYDLAKLISTLSIDKRPVLALLSDLPTGPGLDPLSGQPTLGWAVDRQLAELFELRRLQPNPGSIGEDVDLLMLVHPKNFSEDAQYAIDQFVLRGGHLLVFVDPDAESDPAGGSMDFSQPIQDRSSDLPRLFAAWGVEYDPKKAVLDAQNALPVQPDPSQPPTRHLAILGLRKSALNQKDVVTADLASINVASAGALNLAMGSPLKMEALAQSSSSAMLADAERVRAAANTPAALAENFKADGHGLYVIAARLSGTQLASAFPERAQAGHLAVSEQPVNIVVVADTDLLSDRLWVQAQNFLGQQVFTAFANNGDFVYNVVDNLAGNDDLISVRTRAGASRPFERVEVIRRAAEQRYQSQAKDLQQRLDQLEQKLAKLQPETPGAQTPALGREQQAELTKFQEQKLTTRKALREVQHQLNADIDSLAARLKLINILGMPSIVALLAVFVAWRRKRREAGG